MAQAVNMQLVQTILSNVFDTMFTYVFVLLSMQVLYPLLNAELMLRRLGRAFMSVSHVHVCGVLHDIDGTEL